MEDINSRWKLDKDALVIYKDMHYDDGTKLKLPVTFLRVGTAPQLGTIETGQRIIDCINAFEGIEDPIAFMEYHQKLLNDFLTMQSDLMILYKKIGETIMFNPSDKLPTLKPTKNLTQNNENHENNK